MASKEAQTLALEWWHSDYGPVPPEAVYYSWMNYLVAAEKYLEKERWDPRVAARDYSRS